MPAPISSSCSPRCSIELHHLEHPRSVDAVSMRFNLLVPLERVRPVHLRVLRADRIAVPLVLDLFLVGVAGRDALR